jgi:hypothetical protein
MNKSDPLKQFVNLYQRFRTEKMQLEARLAEINRALGEPGAAPASTTSRQIRRAARASKSRRRLQNPISLPKAVVQLTSRRPMTKQEILAEIGKMGYQFAAKNPINSLNTVLYGKKPKFRHEGGRFRPLETSGNNASKGSAPVKRKMSAAARAKISAAAKARWARQRLNAGRGSAS